MQFASTIKDKKIVIYIKLSFHSFQQNISHIPSTVSEGSEDLRHVPAAPDRRDRGRGVCFAGHTYAGRATGRHRRENER